MQGLRYTPLVAEHAAHLDELAKDEGTQRFTRVPVPTPPGYGGEHWIPRYERGRAEGTADAFAVFDEAGAFVGVVMAPTIDRAAREAEIGYLVAPPARGRGAATAMLRWMTRWTFDEQDVLRATLIIDAENPASQKVAERCGYVLEGTMRHAHLKQDVRIDAQLWARLASDPEPEG
ncbi:GNAT family N-acetyltransferase [Conexibacter sp. SYSU D00693]|uniref:GNAT family N-acetyltransferase n=1 Tax=Conexibacter sp. SYSU D00693 TaxID=2812560 RepID=UPI00196B0978|nr:GNAT family protein [Conexibacter sp. SYSU D00693]